MAFQPVPNTASVVVRFIENTTALFIGSNQFHFIQVTPPMSQPAIDGLADEFNTSWSTHLAPLISNAVVYAGCTVTDLTTETAFQASVPAATIGGVSSPRLPGNVTFAIKFNTGLTGRSRRGRCFWIGLAESQVIGNSVDGNLAADIVEGFGLLQDDLLSIGWQFAIVSRIQDGVELPEGIPYPITSVTVTDLRVDTMRSRLRF